jgi:hypothetical protein
MKAYAEALMAAAVGKTITSPLLTHNAYER